MYKKNLWVNTKLIVLLITFLLFAPIALAGMGCGISGVTSNKDIGGCIGSKTIIISGTFNNVGINQSDAAGSLPCDLNLYENASSSPSGTGNTKLGSATNVSNRINLTFNPENYMDSNKRYTMGWNCTNATAFGALFNTSQFSCNATGITWDCYRLGDLPSIGTNIIGNFGMQVIVVMGLIILVVVATFIYKKFGLKPKNRKI